MTADAERGGPVRGVNCPHGLQVHQQQDHLTQQTDSRSVHGLIHEQVVGHHPEAVLFDDLQDTQHAVEVGPDFPAHEGNDADPALPAPREQVVQPVFRFVFARAQALLFTNQFADMDTFMQKQNLSPVRCSWL